jgi:hypothetical protein
MQMNLQDLRDAASHLSDEEFNARLNRGFYYFGGKTAEEILKTGDEENLAKLRLFFNINSPTWKKKRIKATKARKARIELRNRLANDVLITIEEHPAQANSRFKISMNAGAYLTLQDLDIMREEIRKAIKEMEV